VNLTQYDPIHAADMALKELVDLCARLTILISDEIAPLPPVTLLRITSVLAAMDATLYTLGHSVDTGSQPQSAAPEQTRAPLPE
jgi:hypothetical protein